jgi:hypothetical protein
MHVYIFLESNTYTRVYTSIPIYLNILKLILTLRYPYINKHLRTSMAIFLCIFTSFHTHTPIYVYILQRPYTYVRLHSSTPTYAINMFTNIYGHICTIPAYIHLTHVPIHIYIHLHSYTIICLHTSTTIFP